MYKQEPDTNDHTLVEYQIFVNRIHIAKDGGGE